MKQQGLDKAQHYPSIGNGDLKKIYSSGAISEMDPTSLQLKVYFKTALHLTLRGRSGLRELRNEHIVFKLDDLGMEYATLSHNPLEKKHQVLIQTVNMINGFIPQVQRIIHFIL